MAIEVIPEWLASLDEEDVSFIKKFVLASGSLKEVAGIYGVTYPTVRLRLDQSDTEDQAWRAGGRGAVYRAHQASCGQGQAGF